MLPRILLRTYFLVDHNNSSLPCDHILLYVCYWVDHILWSTPYTLCRHVIFARMFQGRPHLVVYPTRDMSPHIVIPMFLGRPQNMVYHHVLCHHLLFYVQVSVDHNLWSTNLNHLK